MNPFEKMTAFNKANPEAKESYRAMQHWQVLHKPENGVFFPSANLYSVSPKIAIYDATGNLGDGKIQKFNQHQRDMLTYFWGLHLFGAWRNTLGIYRLDKDIFKDIYKSQIPDDTPSSIFSRLPEWCVYIEFPQNAIAMPDDNDTPIAVEGFWALFDERIRNGKKITVLNLVLNHEAQLHNITGFYQPLQVIIDEKLTVKESMLQLFSETTHNVGDIISSRVWASSDTQFTMFLLSLLLWLCAEEPDISNIQGEPLSKDALRMPKYRTNKKTGVFIPPSQPTIYDIGKRLGGEIRMFNERIGSGDSRISSRKRPHIRRGHWHGVWSGTGQNKQFKIYWQPAIFVNAN